VPFCQPLHLQCLYHGFTKADLVARCTLYAFSHVPNFKAIGLHLSFIAVFCKCVKRKKKEKEEKRRNLASFYKLLSQEWLGQFS